MIEGDSGSVGTPDIATFVIDGEYYAMAKSDVVAIHTTLPETTFIPGTQNWLIGAYRSGTDLVPLVDLKALFGDLSQRQNMYACAIEVEHPNSAKFAILVDRISDFVCRSDAIEPVKMNVDEGIERLTRFHFYIKEERVRMIDLIDQEFPEFENIMLLAQEVKI